MSEQRDDVSCDDACWLAALARYAADPQRQLRRFLALERSRSGDLPPVVLLALADARLRAGQLGAAQQLFREALALDLGDPWHAFASLGLAWSAAATGDSGGARATLEPLIARGADGATLAAYLTAMLEAVDGAPNAASERFVTVRDDRTKPADVRAVAALGAAYAAYWDGDDRRAGVAFAEIAASGPDALRDDARYGAALAELRSGDAPRAHDELIALAGESTGGAAVSRALVRLEPRALLERGFRRYRHGRLAAPQQQMLRLIDIDGAALARALLRRIDRDDVPAGDATASRTDARAAHAIGAGDQPSRVDDQHAGAAPAPVRGATSRAWRREGLVAAVLVTAALFGWRRRLHAGRRRRIP